MTVALRIHDGLKTWRRYLGRATAESSTAQAPCHRTIIRARSLERTGFSGPVTMIDTAHLVQFFSADDRLVTVVSDHMREGFAAGDTCVAVLTADHRRAIEASLRNAGLNPEALSAEYRYVPLDAETMLASLYDPRTGFDREQFHNDCGLLIRQVSARGQPVRFYGEMVDLLVEQGRPAAAIELEELWNELSRHHNFYMFCTYRVSSFTENPRYRRLLHGLHTHVVPEHP